MKLNSANDYRFVMPDANAFPGGAHQFTGDIMPLRQGESKKIMSYEDICFLQEASNELYWILYLLNGSAGYLSRQTVPRNLYGAEVGRMSFSQDAPMARADIFTGHYLSVSGASPHGGNAENYLAQAGTSVTKLFPCAMETAANLSPTYDGLAYQGAFIPSTVNPYDPGLLFDVFKCLIGLAWSYTMQKRPKGTFAYNLISDTTEKAVLEYTGGCNFLSLFMMKRPMYVSEYLTPVSTPTVVISESVFYLGDTPKDATYTAGNLTIVKHLDQSESLTDTEIAELKMEAIRAAMGAASFAAFDNALLGATAIGSGDLFIGSGKPSDFNELLTSRKIMSEPISALFELPKRCTSVFVPRFNLLSTVNPNTGYGYDMQWHVDSAHSDSNSSGSHSEGGTPGSSTTGSTASAIAGITYLTVSIDGGYDDILFKSGSQEVVYDEAHVSQDVTTWWLNRDPNTSEDSLITADVMGSITALFMVSVTWDDSYQVSSTTQTTYSNTAGGVVVAVPVTLTRRTSSDGKHAEWQSESLFSIYSRAIATARSSVPFDFPSSYNEVTSGIPYGTYVPTPIADRNVTRNRNLRVSGGFGLVAGNSYEIFAAAHVSPRTADQTAN